MNGNAYLADVIARFRELREQCDRAIAQVPADHWGRRLDAGSNSIVTLILHLSGNMRSRWTDFLTTDGEKPDRDRDAEFEDPADISRDALLARWETGWSLLLQTLSTLTAADLERTVLIRSEPHTVVAAIDRQLAHYAWHAGQIVFLAKHLAGESWRTQSVPRGGSAEFNAAKAREFRASAEAIGHRHDGATSRVRDLQRGRGRAMTPAQAVWTGHRRVSLPALCVLVLAAIAGWGVTGKVAGVLLGLVVGMIPAWPWWSYAVPRWRDWLEDQGIAEASVYDLAVKSGLVFPRGFFLELTEFRRRDGSRGWRQKGPG